jgi:hypothetical protein
VNDIEVTSKQLVELIQHLVPTDKARIAYLGKKVSDAETAFQYFKRFIFLDATNIGDSENSYIDGVMGKWKELTYNEIDKIPLHELEKLVLDRLDVAINSADSKHKQAVLTQVKGTLPNGENLLKTTLMSLRMAKEKMPLFLQYMEEGERVKELISMIAERSNRNQSTAIRLYGYTKTTLWIHECGYGIEFSPVSQQIRRFLSENDKTFKTFTTYEREYDSTGQSYFVINDRLKKFTTGINNLASTNYSVSDVDGCICIYEKIKGLAKKRKLGKIATMPVVKEYMQRKGMGIDGFYTEYADIDRVGQLEEDFVEYLKRK